MSIFTRSTVIACAAAFALSPAFIVAASPPVVLGGTSTMRDMLTPANTDAFRAAGGGLYMHQNGWVETLMEGSAPNNTASQNNRKAVWNQFKTSGPGHSELSFGDLAEWTNTYRAYYTNNGVVSDTISVNGLSMIDEDFGATVATSKQYIDAFKGKNGTQNVNIILSPNRTITQANVPFANAQWDNQRELARHGGGWTSDAPPVYFLYERNQTYRNWVIDQTKWTNANGLKSVNIISPRTSGANFFNHTVEYVRKFVEAEAIPQQWVVENYSHIGEPPAGYVNRIGSEDNVNELAYTAKWLLGHVQGRPESLDLWTQRHFTGNDKMGLKAFSTDPEASRSTLRTTPALASTYQIRIDNLGVGADAFYAPHLSAEATGDVSQWDLRFTLGSVDVTDAVLGDGFTLDGADLVDGGETAVFLMYATRLAGGDANAPFNIDVFLKANPSATVIADTMSFSVAVPEPATLTLLAVAGGLLVRRRARA